MPQPSGQTSFEAALDHHRAGRFAEAEAIYRTLLRSNPRHGDFLHLLGLAKLQQDRADEAIGDLRQAVKVAPENSSFHNSLGEAFRETGQYEKAIAAFQRALSLRPDYPGALNNLGAALMGCGRHAEAVPLLQRAIASEATVNRFMNLAQALKAIGHLEAAERALKQARELDPSSAAVHIALASVAGGAGKLDEAIDHARDALAIAPDDPDAHGELAAALAREGSVDESIAEYQRQLELRPSAENGSSLLFMMHYSDRFTPEEIFAAHRKWAEMYETPLRAQLRPHTNDRSSDRPLRIGYVSPDLRRHPVGYFMRPVFTHHDPNLFHVFVYNTGPQVDPSSEFFRARAHTWRDVYPLTAEQLAEQIRADGIDILVDLTLHMANNRLLTFARKPAPVQATYLGYAQSTGLVSMDYKLSDAFLDPPGATEPFHTEKIVRLETNFCCELELAAPDVSPPPATSSGRVTFVSLNTLMKTNAAVIETWAAVLRALPDARLLIVSTGLAGERTRQRVRDRFAAHAIAAERLELLDLANPQHALATLNRADIALDTFPYAGGTTTANCLWMGVPVVTLADELPISRQGLSFLSHVGLPELVANSREQYVSIAIELAKDLDRLAAIRSSLRDRMSRSPIADGARFTRNLESAYRQMWTNWCQSAR